MSQKANFAPDTFSEAYARILNSVGCGGQEDLANKLGVRQSFITDCRRRGEFTTEVLLALVERCHLNPHWVRTGRGQKYLLASTWPRSSSNMGLFKLRRLRHIGLWLKIIILCLTITIYYTIFTI
ncbi:helix-turn-helix domain-containing protein [Desulfovibrio falkowii]|uniref:helix-turn-helix domain-containing protein n=1 Tax=Desulfovibrio falkowii TaxID=3136602 RepID=UPI0038B367ED